MRKWHEIDFVVNLWAGLYGKKTQIGANTVSWTPRWKSQIRKKQNHKQWNK